MSKLNEDSIYRASTQYRIWSFTPEALASLRETTNSSATTRVRSAFRRASKTSQDGSAPNTSNIDCLDPAEELMILRHYTRQLLAYTSPTRSTAFPFPPSVGATAAQYLRRFYLSNSPMTYHPKSLIPTALFLAAKVEDTHIILDEFTRRLRDDMKFTTVERKPLTREDVLALEYVLGMGLRWAFDVRHPFRGLKGGIMEMIAIARGEDGITGFTTGSKSSTQIQKDMVMVRAPPDEQRWKDREGNMHPAPVKTAADLERRIRDAEKRASHYLENVSVLTDVYFLYTPSQIWFASLMLADEPLTSFYLSNKLSVITDDAGLAAQINEQKVRIEATIRSCAKILADDEKLMPTKEELMRIDKKLYQCLNPEKRDLGRIRQEQLRAATGLKRDANGFEDEKKAKKRKTDLSGDEFFGGELVKQPHGNKKTSDG